MQSQNQTNEEHESGYDFFGHLSRAERLALANRLEKIQQNLENSFARIFGKEKGRIEPGHGIKEKI
ncbi:MAG: hypothetical protein V1897_06880 [Pseudomonadota bacterium]